jgi:hypothetical protein
MSENISGQEALQTIKQALADEDEKIRHVPKPTIITENFIAEQVYDRKTRPAYCKYYFESGEIEEGVESIELGDVDSKGRRITYEPIDNDHLRKGLIILPEKPVECSFDEVYREGCDLALSIYDCEATKLDAFKLNIAIAQCSWFLDRFVANPRLTVAGMGRFAPILAYRGPSGSGKNRALNATRLNAYRPFYDQATTRIPSIYRPLGLWQGTLCIDECDLGRSDETAEFIHYLNCRCYGTPIARQNPDSPRMSEAFDNFGLTAVTQRRSWEDNATEDRAIPFYCEKSQKELATSELDEWIEKAFELQNKLLYLRLTLFNRVKIDKSARIEGVKDHRLTASVLPLLALQPFAPEMIRDLKTILVDIERRRREAKAQSRDGVILNSLWDKISEGYLDYHNGTYFVGTKPDEEVDGKRERIVPLTTSQLEETLKLKRSDIRRTITSLQLCATKPPTTARVCGKVYRPIWFTRDRLEKRLQDFVVDYELGQLDRILEKRGVTVVTLVTAQATEQPVGEPGSPDAGPVTTVTSVTNGLESDKKPTREEVIQGLVKLSSKQLWRSSEDCIEYVAAILGDPQEARQLVDELARDGRCIPDPDGYWRVVR